MKAVIEHLASCPSTNSEMAARLTAPHGAAVTALEQTAGRGQRGTSWESEPGANALFSVLIRKNVPVAEQFIMSMLVSLAIKGSIDRTLAEHGSERRARIKWPNDIYVGEEKICGILIENILRGALIHRAIIGAGINVNQTKFVSDAPNPTSIARITGDRIPLTPFVEEVIESIIERFDTYYAAPDPYKLKSEYMDSLMWTDGEHPFTDDFSGDFTAHITDVDFDGTLTLSNGAQYAFKEVVFNIPPNH